MKKLALITILSIVTASVTWAKNTTDKTNQPNIILIMADDLNDFIGVMNNRTGTKTPNIDRLAKDATLFTNAHSNAPICNPSRASLFSGILPHQSGHYAFGNWRKNQVLVNSNTIMEHLRNNGYHTAGAGKLIHQQWRKAWDEFELKPDYTPLAYNGKKVVGHPDGPSPYNKKIGPLDSTFMPLSAVPTVEADGDAPGYKGWWYGGYKKPFKYNSKNDHDLLPDEMYANWTVDKLKQWEKQKLNKPFFLSVGFIRPHTPLVVPDRFYELFPFDKIHLPEFVENDVDDTHFESIYNNKSSLGRKHYNTLMDSFDNKELALKRYYQAYLASIAFMDEQVGKVLDALDNSIYQDNTIVVFTSDHGYNLGEKDNLFKNNLWERSTKVPLIIYDPRNKKQQQITDAVSLVDLFPTFSEFATATTDSRKSDKGLPISGSSLVPLINGNNTAERHALTVVKLWGDDGLKNFSLRTKDWRYILYGNGKEELYDHINDDDEIYNIADLERFAEIKKSLGDKLLLLVADAK